MTDWCRTWEQDIAQYELGDFIDRNKRPHPKGWALYQDPHVFSDHTQPLRESIETRFNNPLSYMGVWDYYPGYVDPMGPHIDGGGKENAVVFCVPRGELEVTMHDSKSKDVLDRKTLSGNSMMILYHTRFMHHITGVGDLVVFGLDKRFDAESYFSG